MTTDITPQHIKAFGVLLIAIGIYTFLFGGTTDDRGQRYTLLGFEFGSRNSRPMSPGEQHLAGVIMVCVGVYLVAFY